MIKNNGRITGAIRRNGTGIAKVIMNGGLYFPTPAKGIKVTNLYAKTIGYAFTNYDKSNVSYTPPPQYVYLAANEVEYATKYVDINGVWHDITPDLAGSLYLWSMETWEGNYMDIWDDTIRWDGQEEMFLPLRFRGILIINRREPLWVEITTRPLTTRDEMYNIMATSIDPVNAGLLWYVKDPDTWDPASGGRAITIDDVNKIYINWMPEDTEGENYIRSSIWTGADTIIE